LALATILVFAPAVGADFVNFDDPDYVTRNPHVQGGISWQNLRWALTNTEAANWHPLTWLSLQVDAAIYASRPWGYHLVNVLLHALSTGLLYWFLAVWTKAPLASALAAILFAWHPLRVESVAWVTERKDVLSGLFLVLTMMSYACYAQRPSIGRYILMLAVYGFGLMAKPTLVTVPILLLLLDWWPLGRLANQSVTTAEPRTTSVSWRLAILEKLPLVLLAVACSALTLWAQGTAGAVRDTATVPVSSRLAHAVVIIAWYLWKTLWPSQLAVFYPYARISWHDTKTLLSFFLLVLLSVILIRQRQKRPACFVGWCWFLIALMPVIGIVQVGSQGMADRYSYIPGIGLALAFGWVLAELARSISSEGRAAPVLAAVLALVLGVFTWRQAGYWHDSVSLWEHALAVTSGNPTVYFNLGTAQARAGRNEEAIRNLLEALRLDPADRDAQRALEVTVLRLGPAPEILSVLHSAMQKRPTDAAAAYALGIVLEQEGQPEAGLVWLRQALEVRPGYWQAHVRAAECLELLGRTADAAGHWQKANELGPPNARQALLPLKPGKDSDSHSSHAAPETGGPSHGS
jgi:hypothetical protein